MHCGHNYRIGWGKKLKSARKQTKGESRTLICYVYAVILSAAIIIVLIHHIHITIYITIFYWLKLRL